LTVPAEIVGAKAAMRPYTLDYVAVIHRTRDRPLVHLAEWGG